MFLPAGMIVRFKGRNGEAAAINFACELRGRCKRDGAEVQILTATKLKPYLPAPDPLGEITSRDFFGKETRTSAHGRNGRNH